LASNRPHVAIRTGTAVAVAAVGIVLTGCSIDADYFTVPDFKKPQLTFTRPDWNFAAKDDYRDRPVEATDLVGPDGRCPGDAVAAPIVAEPPQAAPIATRALYFTAGPQADRPEPIPQTLGTPPPTTGVPIVRGVALGMTECEVVHTIGVSDHLEVSANERGQRAVMITYLRGERPGIYRFVGGRLVSIERTPAPPTPPKPDKKTAKKPSKKPSSS